MTVYTAALTLILVMDPIGNIPVFLGILRNTKPERFRHIIIRESCIAFLILVIFLFFGQYILQGLHITESALGVAGGIILFLIALRMIFPTETPELTNKPIEEPFIVPLAMPFIAGPSTIATVLLLATNESTGLSQWWVALALAIAFLVLLITLLSSQFLIRILGTRVMTACERLMGMLLTTIAVQMLLSGLNTYFKLGLH